MTLPPAQNTELPLLLMTGVAGLALTVSRAAAEFTVPQTPLTVTVKEPELLLLTAGIVYVAAVAPGILLPPDFHW